MKKQYLIAGIILCIAAIAFIVIRQDKFLSGGIACTMEAKLCPDGSSVGRTGPNCEFAPCPAETLCEGGPCPVSSGAQSVTVESPKPNDEIGLPLVISGTASVFENTFGYRLLNADGKKLLEGFGVIESKEAGQAGPFNITVNYPDPQTATGTLEILTFAPVGGEVIDTKKIPVQFAPVDAMEVSVYFNNSNKDPKSLSCATTYPVMRRIAKTATSATEAVHELLRGVTGLESELGYMTALGPNVQLQSLKVEGGVAKADFNLALQAGVAGSCRVQAIRSQIENTLKQFPGVKSVIISIDGRSADILQP